jgi:hypothetical protein
VATPKTPVANPVPRTTIRKTTRGALRNSAVPDAFPQKNGMGRWCNMQVCGARHKMRTYRERKAGSG